MRVQADLDSTVSLLADGEFPVYAAAIKLGMWFPPHPFVVEVLDGFNIGVGKLSKWHNWRKRWVVFHTDDRKMYYRMGCWSAATSFMDHHEALPPLTATEWDQKNIIFKANSHQLTADKSFHVPAQWFPHISQFRDEAFLAAVGLGYSMTKGSVLGHGPRDRIFHFSCMISFDRN